jgi:hypothetical protein
MSLIEAIIFTVLNTCACLLLPKLLSVVLSDESNTPSRSAVPVFHK